MFVMELVDVKNVKDLVFLSLLVKLIMFHVQAVVTQMVMESVICVEVQEEFKLNNLIKKIMRRLVLVILVFLFVSLSIHGQTYCYRLLHRVNNQGVKMETAHTYKYVTFVNNMTLCYESDESGNKKLTTFADAGVCQYRGQSGGNHVYIEPNHQVLGSFNSMLGESFYFSSDFSRMNYKNKTFPDMILVYEKVSAPKDEEAPIELY